MPFKISYRRCASQAPPQAVTEVTQSQSHNHKTSRLAHTLQQLLARPAASSAHRQHTRPLPLRLTPSIASPPQQRNLKRASQQEHRPAKHPAAGHSGPQHSKPEHSAAPHLELCAVASQLFVELAAYVQHRFFHHLVPYLTWQHLPVGRNLCLQHLVTTATTQRGEEQI